MTMELQELSGMHRMKNSRYANLENNVLDGDLINLIFRGEANGMISPGNRLRFVVRVLCIEGVLWNFSQKDGIFRVFFGDKLLWE